MYEKINVKIIVGRGIAAVVKILGNFPGWVPCSGLSLTASSREILEAIFLHLLLRCPLHPARLLASTQTRVVGLCLSNSRPSRPLLERDMHARTQVRVRAPLSVCVLICIATTETYGDLCSHRGNHRRIIPPCICEVTRRRFHNSLRSPPTDR